MSWTVWEQGGTIRDFMNLSVLVLGLMEEVRGMPDVGSGSVFDAGVSVCDGGDVTVSREMVESGDSDGAYAVVMVPGHVLSTTWPDGSVEKEAFLDSFDAEQMAGVANRFSLSLVKKWLKSKDR